MFVFDNKPTDNGTGIICIVMKLHFKAEFAYYFNRETCARKEKGVQLAEIRTKKKIGIVILVLCVFLL